jgi:hypothetical protein
MLKLAMLAICLASAAFMLRVLTALLRECLAPVPLSIRGYLARFVPSRKRGEVIMMNDEILKRKAPTKAGERIALACLLAVSVAIPLRGQQAQDGPQGSNSAEASPATQPEDRATMAILAKF